MPEAYVESTSRTSPAVEDVITHVPDVIKESRDGWKTTEFWLAIVTGILVQIDAIPLPDKYEGWVATALVVAYALSRGLAKQGVPVVEEGKQPQLNS